MYCEESLSVPLKPFHVKKFSKIPDTHKGFFPRSGIGKTSEEILSRVAEYAQREFSYTSDALDAFQGVFRAFQSLDSPVRHICGVLVLSPSMNKTTKLLKGSEMFIFGLSWNYSGKVSRRLAFPSWSWLGWDLKRGNDGMLSAGLRPKTTELRILAAARIERAPGVHDD
jgi:hypothetical protein